MKLIRTTRGARLVHGSSVISELLRDPGPTHSVFDLFAAATVVLGRGDRVAMLGFAGGGTVAPIRALGFQGKLRAVDLDLTAVPYFRKHCSSWAGEVEVDEADAASWLAKRRGKFDVILEDLSVNLEDDVGKPEVSFTTLPTLMKKRLADDGIAVLNALPEPDLDWDQLFAAMAHPWKSGAQILFDEWVNRFLIVGRKLPPPEKLTQLLREPLRRIGSQMAEKFVVKRFNAR